MDLAGSAPPSHALPTATRRPVDGPALERTLARMQRAATAPWLHAEVARRMAERLAVIKLRPQVILDWAAHLGGGGAALRSAYASMQVRPDIRAVEPFAAAPRSPGVAPAIRVPWWSAARWRHAPPAPRPPLAPSQVAQGSAQLIWSNMTLHAQQDPALTLGQWHRCLAVDGFLMFSTLGPGSLPELRSLYDVNAWGPAMAPLVDMHDLGDMLVSAGFADPVMDQEQIVLTWADADAALAELRTLGANADPQRHRGLRTPAWRQQLAQALHETARARADARVALTFEVAYGHAFRPPTRARVAPEARVDLADFRAMTRAPRR